MHGACPETCPCCASNKRIVPDEFSRHNEAPPNDNELLRVPQVCVFCNPLVAPRHGHSSEPATTKVDVLRGGVSVPPAVNATLTQ